MKRYAFIVEILKKNNNLPVLPVFPLLLIIKWDEHFRETKKST